MMLGCRPEAPAEAIAVQSPPALLPCPCVTMPVFVAFGCLKHSRDRTLGTSRDDVQGESGCYIACRTAAIITCLCFV